MPASPTKLTSDQDDQLFKLLRQLDLAPDASQRVIAQAIGVSLGRLNALLRHATDAGLVQITDHKGPDKRARFAYSITPRGAATKNRLTDQFLTRKFAEYDALHAELTGTTSGLSPLNYRTKFTMSNLEPIPELYVSYDSAQKMKADAGQMVSHDLTPRQICDLELLMNGGFNPLKGFLSEADYNGVVENMRLADGQLWPMPITLDVSEDFAASLEAGQDIALRDQEGVILATMTVTDNWVPNKALEAEKVFGADDDAHPAVNYLHNQAGKVYLGGPITGIQQPVHYDFKARRDTPNEMRAYFRKMGWRKVVAFQTRNPLHRAHQELTFRAAREAQANLLIHPVVGLTKPGDVDHFTRVRCYEAVLDKYPQATTSMSLLNLAMRMAGPREAVWHGLIRKNHGCTHFIVGRDHAGPGNNSAGEDFYGPYDAQDLFRAHQEEMGIEMVDFKHMVWVQERAQYEAIDEIKDKDSVTILNISGTELRRRLAEGLEIPEWFSFPEVVKELRRRYPPRSQQGFTVFFTGFSGSGKSTIANALKDGPASHRVGLVLEGRLPAREGAEVFSGDTKIGAVTSGGFSPTLGDGRAVIAREVVDGARARRGQRVAPGGSVGRWRRGRCDSRPFGIDVISHPHGGHCVSRQGSARRGVASVGCSAVCSQELQQGQDDGCHESSSGCSGDQGGQR